MLTMQRLPLPAAPLRLAPGLGKAAHSPGTERMEELLPSASHHTGSRHSRVAAWGDWDATVCIAKETKHKLSSTPSAAVAGMGLPYEDGAGLGKPGPHPSSTEITAPGDAFTSCSGSCLSLQSSRQNRQLINSTLTAPSCPAWPQQQEETPMGPTPLSQLYPPWELYLHSSVDLSPRACPPHAIHHVGTLGLRGGGKRGGGSKQEGNYTASPPPHSEQSKAQSSSQPSATLGTSGHGIM